MPSDLRKTRKRRGSRYCGWGQVGQHRRGIGGGGGSGKTDFRFMSYFGKIKKEKGFDRKPHISQMSVLNIGELDEMSQKIKKNHDGLILDLNELGFEKLLGSGNSTLKNITVVINTWTSKAEVKLSQNSCKLEKPVNS